MIFAGFGGQGVLFIGKVVSYMGLIEGKEVSWLPSYGPEMRGGTANCSVCISENKIGSPLVTSPNVLIAMNLPSYVKFIDSVAPEGVAILDKTLISKSHERTDINIHEISATQLSSDKSLDGLANIMLLGKAIKEAKLFTLDIAEIAIEKCVSSKKAHLLEANKKALKLGYSM